MAVHALEKGAAGAPCFASAPRKRGQVRKSFPRKGWHARFQFSEDRKKVAFHGPLRLLREEAEADRQFVDASIARESSYSSAEVAKRVLQSLSLQSLSDDPGSASSAASACSASIVPVFAPGLLQKMTKLQLRQLATITPGFQRNKKTVAGKWIPKTSQEIAAGLLALPASASTQALPGLRVVRKRPASSVPRTRKALNT